ncbi:uncharacterized protein BDW43DRAFT_291838 [Aspergillus alliaceus]|uniref:uncharacterized protein n=1 Tax=Petromyces alliaceus TaxID=209559 RepID=UPI0012A76B8A|nr:uncharacterized protein BDW43DRAFT_291838 [Aspergillus alliaceus]KAB8228236.1 hypothetical protein BDW43DRAFT_291838 [Aspergillus alliaceus]
MPKMVYTVADFDNPQVREAANPSTIGGWHHGPVPYANADWTPPEGTITPEINGQAPNPGERFSGVNGRVCDVAVNGDQMCGRCFSSMIAYRRHLRQSHPGASANPNTANISDAELTAGQNALKRWVLEQGWRRARYLHEPGRGPLNGLINEYADACEQIARTNASFRAAFGDRFHRDPVILPPSSGRRKRNRGPTPPSTPEPEPEPAPPVKKIATRGGRKGKGRTSAKRAVRYNYA